jgi:SOS response regulatory protein OraA/RecX
VELASKAAASKLRSLKKFDTEKRKTKLTAFLAGRGFDWDTIKKVIRETFPEGTTLKGSFGHSEEGDSDADNL